MNRNKIMDKKVQDAVEVIVNFLDGSKTTDEAAIKLALAVDKDKCNILALAFRDAEMRYITKQVKPAPKRKTVGELFFSRGEA